MRPTSGRSSRRARPSAASSSAVTRNASPSGSAVSGVADERERARVEAEAAAVVRKLGRARDDRAGRARLREHRLARRDPGRQRQLGGGAYGAQRVVVATGEGRHEPLGAEALQRAAVLLQGRAGSLEQRLQ